MKELQPLLGHIDSYINIDDEEEIVIRHTPCAAQAQKVYEDALRLIEFKESEEGDANDDDSDDYKNHFCDPKWEFDIALDCIRTMDDDDREYVRNHLQPSEYHFGYAMGIRNRYIHPSRKHQMFMPDRVSGRIMTIILSIVSPIYNFRNDVITGFLIMGNCNNCWRDTVNHKRVCLKKSIISWLMADIQVLKRQVMTWLFR